MASLQKCEIKDLVINTPPIFIICLVIAKQGARIFSSKNDGDIRGVITFTVRDSKRHIINCNIWGSQHYIETTDNAFRVGDLVAINRPSVLPKTDNHFAPQTTVPYSLVVNEGTGYIFRESTEHYPEISKLFHESIKPTSGALYLTDVMNKKKGSGEDFVDLLVMVRSIDAPRTINTKNGIKELREIYVMDSTCNGTMLTFWGNEYIQRANDWSPMVTILHLISVGAAFSDFNKRVGLTMRSKTIITENPVQSSRVNALMEYIIGLSDDDVNSLEPIEKPNYTGVNLNEIKEVMNVRKIISLGDKIDESGGEFTAISYAVITKFQIDSGFGAISKQCISCRKFLRGNNLCCENDNCKAKFLKENVSEQFVRKFFVSIDVSDHTGTLNCHLTDSYAEKVLQCSVEQFLTSDEEFINELKSKFLLNRFALKLLIKQKTPTAKMFASILDIYETDPLEMASKIKL